MKFTKQHEGKIIYAIPTGNAARYDPELIQKFKVFKVKTKYVEMSKVFDSGEVGHSNNYCQKTGATQKSVNAGYMLNSGFIFFETIKDIENHMEHAKIKKEIYEFFRYEINLSFEQCKNIIEIIK